MAPDVAGTGPTTCIQSTASTLIRRPTTYWATVRCEARRFKLRVRYYSDDPGDPLFFEIKRRENDCILKHRGAVHRSAGAALLSGEWPCPEHLHFDKASHLVALQRFCRLMLRLNARPTIAVSYMREAWMSPYGNSARLTIDRDVMGEPRREPIFGIEMREAVRPFGDRRVLELKFTDRFPDWFRDLAQQFELHSRPRRIVAAWRWRVGCGACPGR